MAKKVFTDKIVVLVTCASAREGRRVARALVERRLVACVSLLTSPVESVYRWKGKVKSAKEFLLVVKTVRKRFAAIQAEVRRLHSYEVPEIIALPIAHGSPDYLGWITDSVRGRKS